jgi:hypothetical protein
VAPRLLLDHEVHDMGDGDRPSRHLAIASFALARSQTQTLLGGDMAAGGGVFGTAGACGAAASAAALASSADKVSHFLLNPRRHPQACFWEDRAAPSVMGIDPASGRPALVPTPGKTTRRVLVVPAEQVLA